MLALPTMFTLISESIGHELPNCYTITPKKNETSEFTIMPNSKIVTPDGDESECLLL